MTLARNSKDEGRQLSSTNRVPKTKVEVYVAVITHRW